VSTGYQIDDQFGTYFITPIIVDWVDVFTRKIYRDIIINCLDFCIKEKALNVYGYVIMSNHLHLIVRSTNGSLSNTIRDFKKFTANSIINAVENESESRKHWLLHRFEWNAHTNERSSKYQVWTHENHAEIIYSYDFFVQKLNYIHENPVRAGLVELPEEYLYSSAKSLIMHVPGQIKLHDWYE